MKRKGKKEKEQEKEKGEKGRDTGGIQFYSIGIFLVRNRVRCSRKGTIDV